MGTSSSSAMMQASVVLPKPGRTVEQHVIHGLAALARGLDGDGQVLLQLFLAGEVGQRRGRRPASNCASSGCRAPETSSRSGIRFSLPYQFQSAPEKRLEFGVGGGGAAVLRALRTAASAAARAHPRFSSAESTSCSMAVNAALGAPGRLAPPRRRAPASCRATPAPCARRSSCRRRECAPAGPPRRAGCWRSDPARRMPESTFIAILGPMPLTPKSAFRTAPFRPA